MVPPWVGRVAVRCSNSLFSVIPIVLVFCIPAGDGLPSARGMFSSASRTMVECPRWKGTGSSWIHARQSFVLGIQVGLCWSWYERRSPKAFAMGPVVSLRSIICCAAAMALSWAA